MRLGLTARILLYFFLLAIITLGNFGFLLRSEKEIKEHVDWVLHTHQVIEESDRLIGHLRDAETGQRGFLLTLDDSYLEPYDNGIRGAKSVFKRLKDLTQDNADQQARLVHIHHLIEQKSSELERTIHLAKQDKRAEAMTFVKSNEGKDIMDRFRSDIREFRSEEERLLKLRTQDYLTRQTRIKYVFVFEALILIVLLIVVGVLIQRNVVGPIVRMRKSIENREDKIDTNEISLIEKTSHNEIGILAKEFNKLYIEIEARTKEKDQLISDLQSALGEVETLRGIIPICSYCHNIRNDQGAWSRLEAYISERSEATFSHGICPNCMKIACSEAGLDDDAEF